MSRPLTLNEAAAVTAGAAMWASVAVPDAGIESFTMADGPMGIASGRVDERDVSLLTPCPTALGASWDADLVRRIGALVGGDAVARGVDLILAPTLNLARSPLAGRAFEYFSEDPLLTGLMGAAWIEGVQSTGTGACAKHLVCNDSETARDSVDVQVDERTLREVYLLPFQFAVEAGCAAILSAYNRVNGQWNCEQHHVITEIVKGEWGFDKAVMSDWFATQSTAGCLNGGLDLEMPGPFRFMGPKAAEAVAAGEVSEARVFDAAARVVATAKAVHGAKSKPTEDAAALLEEAAAAGKVLLKNEGDFLPLAPGAVKRIAVIGPNAAAPCYQGGTFAKIAVAPDTPVPIESIRARYQGQTEINFEPGVDPQPRLPTMPMPMTVAYFDNSDCAGDPLSSETRDTNSLVWFVGMHDQGTFDRPASIRSTGRFTPERDGAHIFYLGATGEARVLVDGREVLKAGGALDAKDVMGVLKRGDAESESVQLKAGVEVQVSVEFRYQPARVQGLWYGVRSPDSPEAMLARAVEAARNVDAVFLIVGETSDSSVESKDRPDTKLPAEQLRLIEAVLAANPRTAIIANVGHAFDANFANAAPALLSVWYPGQGYAPALAKVLAGDWEPGGRLPVTLARDEADYPALCLQPDPDGKLTYGEGINIGYRGMAQPALYPLGAGMGYAKFEWSDVVEEDGGMAVTVRNISNRAGSEVVQLYRDEPETALVGFARVHLLPGEERRVLVRPEPHMMRVWEDGWKVLDEGIKLHLKRDAEA